MGASRQAVQRMQWGAVGARSTLAHHIHSANNNEWSTHEMVNPASTHLGMAAGPCLEASSCPATATAATPTLANPTGARPPNSAAHLGVVVDPVLKVVVVLQLALGHQVAQVLRAAGWWHVSKGKHVWRVRRQGSHRAPASGVHVNDCRARGAAGHQVRKHTSCSRG